MPILKTLSIAVLVFIIDRLSKWFVVEALDLASRYHIQVLPPYFDLTMAWNTGINFGLLGGDSTLARVILIVVALGVVGALLFWSRNKHGWIIPIASGAVIGGALGNVLDRLTYGAVADFINMSCCGINNPYAFNVADVAIFGGAAMLLLFGDKKKN